MIEQGIMTWLPTFNKKVLHLPENISIMMASILSISLGIGRFVGGLFFFQIQLEQSVAGLPRGCHVGCCFYFAKDGKCRLYAN